MEFFGISGTEALVIACVGLIILGPKTMVNVARTLLKARSRLQEFQQAAHEQMQTVIEETELPDISVPQIDVISLSEQKKEPDHAEPTTFA
ncbi:Sec-independent protein translocase subunit TatA/TatB [Schaalia sp. lx-260]|uniref:Sec-independent protein translocase subunit TatA/TatB n=1 Tax=Schaalia sp. lx-260 TaxID=2899082 RepID=UPI001E5DE08A|nr:twin-arginine translocase TatA/TatE family subunit [Schaalia sp. lx-260]MCD4549798.1 twin-arginine translocase TatA/TatE family subunit [Schaalia sp. lx-260]